MKVFSLVLFASLTAIFAHAAQTGKPAATPSSASAQCEQIYQKWLAGNSAEREKIAPDLWQAIIQNFDWDEMPPQLIEKINAVTSNGQFAQKTIHSSLTAKKITVRVLQKFTFDSRNKETGEIDVPNEAPTLFFTRYWIIRRMTDNRFELWEPFHGRLFNSNGKILVTANVPRRDGTGREWYGAFLSDGRWATTDLWDYDGQLSIYSRGGKWLKSLESKKLVPFQTHKAAMDSDSSDRIIGWARCDRTGKKWIVSVGSAAGRGRCLVSPSGAHHVLKNPSAPWQFCYPRDLEPKGDVLAWLSIPSDDYTIWLQMITTAHGIPLEFPCYALGDIATIKSDDINTKLRLQNSAYPFRAKEEHAVWLSRIYNDSGNFGFWPESHHYYISREPYDDDNTWLFNAKGEFEGWIAATRIGDAANGMSMLFANGDQVITLTPKLKITAIRQFTLPDGTALTPVKIFNDLHLGFFRIPNAQAPYENASPLLLVSWKNP